MRQITTTVYQFEELDDKAKERARDWYREDMDLSDSLRELFEHDVGEAGYPTEKIEWSLGYCQGDGMAFYGRLTEEDLVRVAERLYTQDSDMLKRVRSIAANISVTVCRNGSGRHYSHYNCMTIEILNEVPMEPHQFLLFEAAGDYNIFIDDLENDIQADVKELSKKLEKMGYDEIEYQRSAEQVDQIIIDMQYEFTKAGKRTFGIPEPEDA